MKFPNLRVFVFIVIAAIVSMVPSYTFANFLGRGILPSQGISEQMALLLFGALLVGSATVIKKRLL
ncbi:MAG: hypothetical protein WBG37_03940 [Desulfobacterales bacterium]|jgi:hypothetical protein